MDDTSTTTATLDQADEEILTYTVSDEALEAAAGTERGALKRTTAGVSPSALRGSLCCSRPRDRSVNLLVA
jgi:hypothetical protein